jgi:hypothetical protein
VNTLAALFPAGDYRFQLGLQKAAPADFFVPRDPTGRILAERRHWLERDVSRYARIMAGAEGLVEETCRLATGWGVPQMGVGEPLIRLGGALEPDLLWLAPDEHGTYRLRGGLLCFPTGWALEEKLGHPMDFIHGPVPGLNPALGSQISQFLARLKPGTACTRHNWGLAATPELNLHPSRVYPHPSLPLNPAQLWLRVEHQILMALPSGQGLLFGIRIEIIDLEQVRNEPAAAKGLARALSSMPMAVAAYKRLDTIRDELSRWLIA